MKYEWTVHFQPSFSEVFSASVITHVILTLHCYLSYLSAHCNSCEVHESDFLNMSLVAARNKFEWKEQIIEELLRFEVSGVTFTLC